MKLINSSRVDKPEARDSARASLPVAPPASHLTPDFGLIGSTQSSAMASHVQAKTVVCVM